MWKVDSQGNKKINGIAIAMVLLAILLLSGMRIIIQVLETHKFENDYGLESGTEYSSFSSIEEIDLMYENLDYGKIIAKDTVLREALLYISNDMYVNYTLEFDDPESEDPNLENFQITYRLSDDYNREWTVYYNHEEQGILFNIAGEEIQLEEIINLDCLQHLTLNLYHASINTDSFNDELIQKEGTNNFYYSYGNLNIDVNINEDDADIQIYFH